jgi:hypothetical protein
MPMYPRAREWAGQEYLVKRGFSDFAPTMSLQSSYAALFLFFGSVLSFVFTLDAHCRQTVGRLYA